MSRDDGEDDGNDGDENGRNEGDPKCSTEEEFTNVGFSNTDRMEGSLQVGQGSRLAETRRDGRGRGEDEQFRRDP